MISKREGFPNFDNVRLIYLNSDLTFAFDTILVSNYNYYGSISVYGWDLMFPFLS